MIEVIMTIIEELERIFSSVHFTNETILQFFLFIFALLFFLKKPKITKKEKGMIEEIQGEWEYKLTYALEQNPDKIDIVIEGEFKLGVAPDSNNKHLIINGERDKNTAVYHRSNGRNEVTKELEREVTWRADWAEYCHDKKIRFTYYLSIPDSNNEVKVLVESDDFARGQKTIRGKQYILIDDKYKSLIDNANINTEIEILDDLKIPYKTFFQVAKIEANKK